MTLRRDVERRLWALAEQGSTDKEIEGLKQIIENLVCTIERIETIVDRMAETVEVTARQAGGGA